MTEMFSRAKKEFNGHSFLRLSLVRYGGFGSRETTKSLRVSNLHFKPGELFSRRIFC
jgi:hypothetical protein